MKLKEFTIALVLVVAFAWYLAKQNRGASAENAKASLELSSKAAKYFISTDFIEAERLATQAIDLDSRNGEAYFVRAQARYNIASEDKPYYKPKKLQEAIEDYKLAYNYLPDGESKQLSSELHIMCSKLWATLKLHQVD